MVRLHGQHEPPHTFNEEKDEDIPAEEGPQIERVTVFLMDTWHCEICQRNILDKRLPREACFDLDDARTRRGDVDNDTEITPIIFPDDNEPNLSIVLVSDKIRQQASGSISSKHCFQSVTRLCGPLYRGTGTERERERQSMFCK